MVFQGTNITDATSRLQPATLDALYARITGDNSLRDDIDRLRRVRQMDQAAYTRLKVRLPYLCAAQCREGVRRTDHFEAINWFTLDVDHYSGSAEELRLLADRLRADERVALMFVSPGGDGIKLLFRLEQPCTDTKRYSDAYKGFAFAFGQQYDLGKHVDFRTSDATRVCFLSYDEQAYCNPESVPVDWRQYLPEQAQPALALLVAGDQQESASPGPAGKPGSSHQIHPETYAEILARLKTRARPNPMKRDVFVPEALQAVMPAVQQALSAEGITLEFVRDISFGRQLSLTHGQFKAELNLFYGRKGFSVVHVPKRNTHPKLADVAIMVVEQAIYSQLEWPQGQSLSDGSATDSGEPAQETVNFNRYA